MKKYIYILLIIILCFSWYKFVDNLNSEDEKFSKSKTLAYKYFENEMYEDALKNLFKTLKIKEDREVSFKIVETYILLNKPLNAFEYLRGINVSESSKLKEYKKIFSKLVENKDMSSFNLLYLNLEKELKDQIRTMIEGKYDEFSGEYKKVIHSPTRNYSITQGSKTNLIDSQGAVMNHDEYKSIYDCRKEIFTACKNNEVKAFTYDGKVKANTREDLPTYIQDHNLFLVAGEKYKFINKFGDTVYECENATNFNNGYAFVKNKNWKLVDTNFNIIEEYSWKDMKKDVFNEGIINGKAIIKKDLFYIYDLKKKEYSKGYDDIDFYYNDLIAVKKNGKWGYIDESENLIIKNVFEHAKSFTKGIGIIKLRGKYKGINRKGKEIINGEFDNILKFNNEGISFINKKGKWKQIKLWSKE